MTTAELNRKYFDSVSDSYDSKPWWTTVNNKVADTLRSDLPWIGIPFANTDDSTVKEVRLLDYACGTGLMTRVFGPYVTQTLAIDISPNMVSSYNSRAASANIPSSTVHAVVGDLFDKSNPSPTEFSAQEWSNFDIVTVGFGFHHFEDVVFAAGQLKERLRPGGVLVINDFLEGGDHLDDGKGGIVVGSEGNHAVHGHGHEEKDVHGHKDHHHHHHHHHEHASEEKKHDVNESNPEFLKKMKDSIVVPHFTIDGVKEFFIKAGFVDVDVKAMEESVYMEFGGKKLWRTILFARGRRPFEDKSEL
ncbi:S-adenosyl-L-methionine-dependent methyltransferase [Plenodomus tracheiphilus IPT5]|uniref:S-adenosyl-L-methionine-dependent methyltransferase n=1 Tax=Plenodomus tracheiphilus IPT5 TaxID=1408161 RepID=A0A6A7B6Y6_9PLEO|nr:S-adenosyl-L-methionine-dependent methyltransferase [Plenodomus tracheiphilus IPT5]